MRFFIRNVNITKYYFQATAPTGKSVLRNIYVGTPQYLYTHSLKEPFVMKLDSALFRSVVNESVLSIGAIFNANNHEIRIAGGAVRDILQGKIPADVDFATTALPEEMKEMFTKKNIRLINSKGESHGTITVRINDKNYEITTLRIDILTDGRRAQVQFTKNWYMDASRRDLTINSMFLDLNGTLYDYYNGYEDLKQHRVVFVGKASDRIQEDYLRILRYFRFYGRIAKNPNDHDEGTLIAIRENAEGLSKISGERIWSELSKTISGNHGIDLLKKIISLGLGKHMGLPEKCNVEELDELAKRLKQHDFTVTPITILTALLESAEDVTSVFKRLKLSGFERDLAYFLVANRTNEYVLRDIRYYKQLVALSKKVADTYSFTKELLQYQGEAEKLAEFEKWKLPRFPVHGKKILEKGIVEGLHVGFIMQQLKQIWVDSDFTMSLEDLESHIPILSQQYLSTKKFIDGKNKT